MAAIAAAKVITPTGVLERAVVDVDDSTGLIVEVALTRGSVPDRVLSAGFVDIQVNGIDDVDVAQASGADWDRLDDLLAGQGTTTWCPTLVTAPLDSYAPRLVEIADAQKRPPARAQIAGAHLEGPFLGGAPGAHRRELIVPPDLGWIAALPDVVTLTTLGPEALRAGRRDRGLPSQGRRHVARPLDRHARASDRGNRRGRDPRHAPLQRDGRASPPGAGSARGRVRPTAASRCR